MYVGSFLETIHHIEETLGYSVEAIDHHGKSTDSVTNLNSILLTLRDYTSLIEAVNFTPQKDTPEGGESIVWCIEQRKAGHRIKEADIPEQLGRPPADKRLIETVADTVLIPLGTSGPTAFAWLPLLEALVSKLESIVVDLDTLRSRANADCNKFLATAWSAAYYHGLIAYRVTKIKYIPSKTVFEFRGDLDDIRRNSSQMG